MASLSSTSQTNSSTLSDTEVQFERRPDRQEHEITSADGVVTLCCKLDQIGSIEDPTTPLAQLLAKAIETGSTKIVLDGKGEVIESKSGGAILASRLGRLRNELKSSNPSVKASITLTNIPKDLEAEWISHKLHIVFPIGAIRDPDKHESPLQPVGTPQSFLPQLIRKPPMSQVDILLDDGTITVTVSKPRCTYTDLRPVERTLERDKCSHLKIVFTHDCKVLTNDAATGIGLFAKNRSGQITVSGCLSAEIKQVLTDNDVQFSEDQSE